MLRARVNSVALAPRPSLELSVLYNVLAVAAETGGRALRMACTASRLYRATLVGPEGTLVLALVAKSRM